MTPHSARFGDSPRDCAQNVPTTAPSDTVIWRAKGRNPARGESDPGGVRRTGEQVAARAIRRTVMAAPWPASMGFDSPASSSLRDGLVVVQSPAKEVALNLAFQKQ